MSLLDLDELRSSRRAGRLVRIPPEMDVPVTPRVMRIVDSAAFRRLGTISQLGLVGLVYPGARHTRFEHSLGVYRLALLALEQLAGDEAFAESVSEQDARLLILAALLHDIGHWPYCHPIEDMRLPHIQRHEVNARQLICSGELAGIISDQWQTDPAEVADLIAPITGTEATSPATNNPATSDPATSDPVTSAVVESDGRALMRGLLSGPIDIDKLDYLQRDSLHAGVPYGRNFDQRRLLGSLCVGPTGRDIGITLKGKTAAEMLVFSRYVMFSEVYWHHTVRAATAMLQRLVFELGERLEDSRTWLGWSDFQMQQQLEAAVKEDSRLGRLFQGLFGPQRRPYKRLLAFNFAENPSAHQALARRSYGQLVVCAERLAQQLSRFTKKPLVSTELLIDAPPMKLEVQFRLSVRTEKNGFQPLANLSPVVRSLATEQFDNYVKKVHVFVAADRRRELDLSDAQLIEELLRAAE